MLVAVSQNLEEGIELPGLDGSIAYHKIGSEDIVIGLDDDLWLLATDAGEPAIRGERLR